MKPKIKMAAVALAFSVSMSSNALSQNLVQQGVYNISGIDEKLPDQDLRVLHAYLANKTVIGLGETEHGTLSDQARFRFLKYLVEKESVRTIIGEFPDFASLQKPVQDYLLTCQGDPEKLIQFNYVDFQTKEMLGLMKWVCAYNLKHSSNPVRFMGSDNYLFDANLKFEVLSKLGQVSSDFAPYISQISTSCFGVQYSSREALKASAEYQAYLDAGFLDASANQKCLGALDVLRTNYDQVTTDLDAMFGARYSILLAAAIDSLYAYQQVYATMNLDNWHTADSIRDQIMGQNFIRLTRYFSNPGKSVFLAHNFHIAKSLSTDNIGGFAYVTSAGEWLKARFQDQYISIGMTGYNVQSFERGQYKIPDSAESLDLTLSVLPNPYYLIDTRGSFVAAKEKWFIFGSNNSNYPNGWFTKPSDQFDLLFFMKDCLASHPI